MTSEICENYFENRKQKKKKTLRKEKVAKEAKSHIGWSVRLACMICFQGKTVISDIMFAHQYKVTTLTQFLQMELNCFLSLAPQTPKIEWIKDMISELHN